MHQVPAPGLGQHGDGDAHLTELGLGALSVGLHGARGQRDDLLARGDYAASRT